MQEIQTFNIEGAKALGDQYKLPVCSILKGGLERIQDDELDIESIEKGLDENSGLELAKPFTWINMLNTVGSIGFNDWSSGTVVGMIGAFAVLTSQGMGGEASKWLVILVVKLYGQPLLVWLWRSLAWLPTSSLRRNLVILLLKLTKLLDPWFLLWYGLLEVAFRRR